MWQGNAAAAVNNSQDIMAADASVSSSSPWDHIVDLFQDNWFKDLELMEQHWRKPLWVCPSGDFIGKGTAGGRVFLEGSSVGPLGIH